MSSPASVVIASGEEASVKPATMTISRDSLLDGSVMASIREIMAKLSPEIDVYTDEQLTENQAAFLKLRPSRPSNSDQSKVWVFAYGSLIWNPAIEYSDRLYGTALGWRRQLNLWLRGGRGSPDKPGLMLGLEKGGSVEGVVYCLPPGQEELELSLVWQRECSTSAYTPRWVEVTTSKGVFDAVTFVTNTDHPWYSGDMSDKDIAQYVSCASGALGSNIEYVDNTLDSLKTLNIRDNHLQTVQELAKKNVARKRSS